MLRGFWSARLIRSKPAQWRERKIDPERIKELIHDGSILLSTAKLTPVRQDAGSRLASGIHKSNLCIHPSFKNGHKKTSLLRCL
jgi:hypothetical protein